MDAAADLVAEYAVHQPVLGDPAEPLERRGADHGVEVVAVTGNLGASPGDPGFDPSALSSSGVAEVADMPSSVANDRGSLYLVKHDHLD